jgi:uncharacterized protein YeaC (DUF1315 family)
MISLLLALLVGYMQLQVGKALAEAKLEIIMQSNQLYENKTESQEKHRVLEHNIQRVEKCCDDLRRK